MKQKRKWITPLIIVVVLVALIVTAVFAAYYKETVELKNTFESAISVEPEISEEFEENDKKLKENVYFNVGDTDYPVYVRAAIVITWQNEDGIVYYKPVEDDDYYIDLNLADWELKDDGFYYYKDAVESGGKTTNLINECYLKDTATPPDGYTFNVEIIVQTVQAIGTTDADTYEDGTPAWQDAW